MPGLANFTVSMLDQGTATRNAVQIANESAQLGATVNTNSSMDASTIAARSLKKNFAATLDLAADIALHPSFPAAEIERQRASRLGQLVQQRENANVLSASHREHGALWRSPSVRLHRNRNGGVGAAR